MQAIPGLRQAGSDSDDRSIRLPRVLMIATGRRSDDSASIQAELACSRLAADGWKVGLCRLAGGAGPAGGRTLSLGELVRMMPRWDIVHVFVQSFHDLLLYTIPAVSLGKFFGRKVVVHVQSSEFREWLERWGRIITGPLRQADLIAVPSEGVIGLLGEKKLRAIELPGIVTCSMFPGRGVKKLQPQILTTRAMELRSNPAVVIQAFRIVKQKYPRAELVMLGDGPLSAEMQELVEGERIAGVTFAGRVPHEAMPEFYGKADLYINASTRPEVPVSLLEASACGLPVIDLGKRESGGVGEIRNHIDLADHIVRLIENPDLVGELSQESLRRATGLDWVRTRGQWTGVYLDLSGRSDLKSL